jgi:hypothetical protein
LTDAFNLVYRHWDLVLWFTRRGYGLRCGGAEASGSTGIERERFCGSTHRDGGDGKECE